MAPESPAWLMSKERDSEAIEALKILRGKDNLEVINNEFKSINENMMQAKQSMNKTNDAGSLSNLLEMINNRALLKPFGVLLLLFPFALNWTGTAAVQFYFVSILRYDYLIMILIVLLGEIEKHLFASLFRPKRESFKNYIEKKIAQIFS